MMQCKICDSTDLKFKENFQPYSDVEWSFGIYDCMNCKIRFALRDNSENYYELLHSQKWGGYANHYKVADNVKKFIVNNDLKSCEKYLTDIGGGIYAEFIKYFNQKEKSVDILEVGCSSGFFCAYLQSRGYRVDGVDVSKTAISYANSIFGPHFFTRAPKKVYDIIYHKGLIGCVDDPKSFLSTYLELLKPGGEMFFNAPNVESLIELNELWVSTPPPDLIYIFHKTTFDYLIDENLEKSIMQLQTRREVIKKNIKKVRMKDYSKYPKQLKRGKSAGHKTNKNYLKAFLDRIALLTGVLLFPFPFVRKIDDEYGMILRIKKL